MRNGCFQKKQKNKRSVLSSLLAAVFAVVIFAGYFWSADLPVRAAEDYESRYSLIIEDDAQLLSEEEEQDLAEVMRDVTRYGHVAFKSIDENYSSTENYIEDYYAAYFGSDSGTVFLIDMDNRNIWIHSNGAVYKVITKAYANTITDNVYRYASDADYYTCAYKAYEQMTTLLEGNKIAQPMKYLSNAFLALILAMLINYFIVRMVSRAVKPSEEQLKKATRNGFKLENVSIDFSHTTKVYDPPSSSSSGGGGGGGGVGGGGGGHSF